MHVYLSYNQVKMNEKYTLKKTFTRTMIFISTPVLFGLINACATFQRMVNKLFANMIKDIYQQPSSNFLGRR